MKKKIFVFLYHFFYRSILSFLTMILFWHKGIRARRYFERKNFDDSEKDNSDRTNFIADLCFEFSSEGEFQQVLPLIQDSLKDGKKIEIIFFSPSVEHAVQHLAIEYPLQIRFMRFPLLYDFFLLGQKSIMNWMTAKKLILVRYDFFPEFYLWSLDESHQLIVLWASFKKERIQNKEISLWKKIFFKQVDYIVFATLKEYEFAHQSGLFIREKDVFDFRTIQIKKRIEMKDVTLNQKFPQLQNVLHHINHFQKKMIFGNVWPSDLFLLNELSSQDFVLIVPHQLNNKNLKRLSEKLKKMNRCALVMDTEKIIAPDTNTIILNKKGILCELYSYFDFCYVGGGFEGSVHSILEPLISGDCHIACGPQHFRSTEYDMALKAQRISEIHTSLDLINWLNKNNVHKDVNNFQEIHSSPEKRGKLPIEYSSGAEYDGIKRKIFSC